MTTNQDSGGVLREEILVEARKKGDEIVAKAMREAETLLAKAAAEAEGLRQEKLEQARREAARRTELILATVPVEAGRLRAARVEALLEAVHDQALEQLLDRSGFDYRESIINLATDAIRKMAGIDFIVKVLETDHTTLGDDLAEQIERRAGRPVHVSLSLEQGDSGAGVVIVDGQGRQVWDNRFIKRMERLWPEMRRQIAAEANFVPRTGSGEMHYDGG